jgi:hypothetical protein
VASQEKVPFVNYALSGDQACDVATRQIFAHKDSPSVTSPTEYSLLIGTNDVDVKGAGPYEAVFQTCFNAAVSWLAIPDVFKVLATSNQILTTGAGGIDSSNNWNAWTTAGQGATVSFPVTLAATGPIYAWSRISDNNPASYSYSLDGTVIGTANTQTAPRIATENGSTNSLSFLRFPVVAAGTHRVTFTQTSEGTNGVSIVGIGTPVGFTANSWPRVLVGTIPYQYNSGKCTASSDEPCLEYIQDIEASVNLFSGDGLDVRLFDTRQYMFGTASEMNDSLHPDALGQVELSHSVEASW